MSNTWLRPVSCVLVLAGAFLSTACSSETLMGPEAPGSQATAPVSVGWGAAPVSVGWGAAPVSVGWGAAPVSVGWGAAPVSVGWGATK
jgi:hypothetical protein